LNTPTFNLSCRILAITWLLILLPLNQLVRPAYNDFDQYYMAGVCVAEHRWDLLYPIPKPNAPGNAGNEFDSDAKPGYSELAKAHGLPATHFHFIQLPPVALILWPLGWVDPLQAHWIWMAVSLACAGCIALQAGWILERCLGEEHFFAGILTLVITISPMLYRGVRVSNMSPMIAAMLGCAAMELARRDSLRGGTAIAGGFLTKYIGAVLIPLAAVLGRWKTIILSIAFPLIAFGITACISGKAVFMEYFTKIAPTLNRSELYRDDQSLQAFLMRVTGEFPLHPPLLLAMHVLQVIVLLIILGLIVSRRQSLKHSVPMVFAASAALIGWMLLFSPICWDHYLIYLFPLWGWLAWEAMQSRTRCVLALVTMVIALVSTPAYPPIAMPEPFNSHLMASVILTMSLGVARLISGTRREQPPANAD
jgi:hypothetical protein